MGSLKRILISSLAGSVVMFVWGGFSHLNLIEGVGFKPLPNETAVVDALTESVRSQGLYFFPERDFSNPTREHETAWMQRYENGPVGILVYRPEGGAPFSSSKMIKQFAANLVVGLIITIVALHFKCGYWRRVALIVSLGCMACAAVSTIYWNWYEFPTRFFLALWLDQVVGFFLAGLAISKLIQMGSTSSRPEDWLEAGTGNVR